MRIDVPTGVGSSFEAIVALLDGSDGNGGSQSGPWKLVRTSGLDSSIPDEWELYDLGSDPIEARNLIALDGTADDARVAAAFAALRERLATAAQRAGAGRALAPYVRT